VTATGPETMVAQRPELSHSVLPHASHWPMLDAPQWFHAELVRFLGRCKSHH
jgi:pimeloyl-ACP methyl ester carboxylesterase